MEYGKECWRGRDADVQKIIDEYPAHQRSRARKLKHLVCEALEAVQDRGEPNPFRWLWHRVNAYRRSSRGSGQFCIGACAWFTDGCYDDPPQSWGYPRGWKYPEEPKVSDAPDIAGKIERIA